MPNLHWGPDDSPTTCNQCDWQSVFLCNPCDSQVCGRHRAAHYPHNISEPEDPSAVTKGSKRK